MSEVNFVVANMSSQNPLSDKIRVAFNSTMTGDSKVSAEVLNLKGMSGRKYRIFINNLISVIEDLRYLEVGAWMGSTLCSAIYKNKVRALAIDNWSQFGGPAAQFFENIGRFKGDATVSFLDSDFRAVNFDGLGKFNVYLFDGPHTMNDQYQGLSAAQPALDDRFVLIVDDWNWKQVRNGTMKAVKELGLSLDLSLEIRTTLDNSHPTLRGAESDWHNGYFITACSKPSGSRINS
jgi:Methyltransferase domain